MLLFFWPRLGFEGQTFLCGWVSNQRQRWMGEFTFRLLWVAWCCHLTETPSRSPQHPDLNGCVQRGWLSLGGVCQEPWRQATDDETVLEVMSGTHCKTFLPWKMYLKTILKISVKGIVHPKMKISPWFTHPQAILGVYDFHLSDEYNRSYIKKCPGSSKLYNDSGWESRFWSPNKCIHPS